ncbi:MAG: hypothetical protein WBB55_00210, partial [Anaerolineales bacterium]
LLVSNYPDVHGNAHCFKIRKNEPMLFQALMGNNNSAATIPLYFHALKDSIFDRFLYCSPSLK